MARDEGHMVVIKSVDAWAAQATEALDRITAANGGQDVARIIDAADLDFEAFASLVEALVALEPHTGRIVGQDLVSRAGLRPVDEVI